MGERISILLPPGVFRQGTEYQSKGRYYDANYVRWYGLALGPIGGWVQRSTTTLTGAPRAALSWKDDSAVTWLAIGTDSNLYISNRLGAVFDITPVGFTSGRVDASAAGGYGSGNYGAGAYGTPRPDSTLILDATEWSLDRFGQYLVGISPDDNTAYQWTLNTSSKAVKLTNSPSGTALVTTGEGFLMILATTDPRTVSWSDQQDDTVWTPTNTNQAGDYPLQTTGRLMCGKTVQGGTLLFTDIDVWLATYIGGTLIYSFNQKGSACGAISRQCVTSFELKAAWMSPDCHFWQYDGYVQPIACDVRDYIIQDINLLQMSKVYSVHNSANFEIEFYYCSGASIEIDRCVIWNYDQNYWNIGRVPRTCGVDVGTFQYPIKVTANGVIYNHEIGWSYDSEPYATGGPIELGIGDKVLSTQYLVPDDQTLGDVTASFTGKFEPDDTAQSFGTYTLTERTPIRFTARQIEVTYTGVTMASWRVGSPRIIGVAGSER